MVVPEFPHTGYFCRHARVSTDGNCQSPDCFPMAGMPDTFDQLLAIAAKRGVSEFEAGPFKVKFGAGVHKEWERTNRPIVER